MKSQGSSVDLHAFLLNLLFLHTLNLRIPQHLMHILYRVSHSLLAINTK